MPEIKNTFTQGKMNKDLDERIIPNGQYRDALNIQVSTSEESDVGAVQNVLSNKKVAEAGHGGYNSSWENVGSISDEKNNAMYSFVTNDTNSGIVQYVKNLDGTISTNIVFCDIGNYVLQFSKGSIITGINVIDGLLFWTDGTNEPKKINIQNCIDGSSDWSTQTKLVVNGSIVTDVSGVDVNVAEQHITVIKKNPLKPLTVKIIEADTDTKAPLFEKIFPRFSYRYRYQDGEYSSYAPFTDVVFKSKYAETEDIAGNVVFYDQQTSYDTLEPYNAAMRNWIKNIELYDFVAPNMPEDVIQVELLYKQEDSPVIYVLHIIKDFDPEWSVNGIVANSGYKGKFTVTSENIYAAIPENQSLRAWDNVPRAAKAQEVTGNRLVYGNYLQSYNMESSSGNLITPNPRIYVTDRYSNPDFSDGGLRSIKSQRSYQVGVVYGDAFGRESPVFTSTDSSISHGWKNSFTNELHAQSSKSLLTYINTSHPNWASYYKFYIKEPSGEYYNMVMSALFNPTVEEVSKEEHTWLAFASSDSNKVSKDDYIILKKTQASAGQISKENKYRILDVKNEAPDAIKYKYISYGAIEGAPDGANNTHNTKLFQTTGKRPASQTKSLYINKDEWIERGGTALTSSTFQDHDLYFSFFKQSITNPETSKRYKIAKVIERVEANKDIYDILLTQPISPEDDALCSSQSAPDAMIEDITVKVEKKIHKGLELFSGKFFVKILKDNLIKEELESINPLDSSFYLQTVSQVALAYCSDVNVSSGFDIEGGLVNNFGSGDDNYTNDPNDLHSGGNLTNTESEWEILNNNLIFGWFIDAMYAVGVQSSSDNYARNITPPWYGGEYDTPNDILPMTNPGTPGWSFWGTAWLDSVDFYGFMYPSSTIGTIPFDLRPLNPGNTGENLANGMEGVVTTVNEHTDADGIRRWNNYNWSNQLGLSTINYIPYDYGTTPGKHFIHLSFLAPGEDLHDGTLLCANDELHIYDKSADNFFDAFTTQSWLLVDQNISPRSLWNNLQAIYGGGIVQGSTSTFVHDPVTNQYGGDSFDGNDNEAGVIPLEMGSANITPNFGALKGVNHAFSNQGFGAVGYNPGTSNVSGDPSNYEEKHLKQWDLPVAQQAFANQLVQGARIQFGNDSQVYTIKNTPVVKKVYNHTPWRTMYKSDGTGGITALGNSVEEAIIAWADDTTNGTGASDSTVDDLRQKLKDFGNKNNRRLVYILELDNDPSASSSYNPVDGSNITTTSPSELNIVIPDPNLASGQVSEVSAIWETEPKDNVDLDIYYEASQAFPTGYNQNTIELFAPVGSQVEVSATHAMDSGVTYEIDEWELWWTSHPAWNPSIVGNFALKLNTPMNMDDPLDNAIVYMGQQLKIINQDGQGGYLTMNIAGAVGTSPNIEYIIINTADTSSIGHGLPWYNCFSFGNGIESDRIRDDFNAMTLSNGVRANITLNRPYSEEHRKNGLIYSGIYNSTSGVNNLNQFIMAEKITKDLNPTYGSIQKLFSRRVSLIAFCEDRVVGITANKNSLYNADGNPQLVSSNAVLGDANPFVGDYGISQNPESFAKDSYRAYFTDKQRGAVLRLSMDGLTPISQSGMSNWFKNEFRYTDHYNLIGSFDTYKGNYNLTIDRGSKSYQPGSHTTRLGSETITYDEDVKGWVSFKSFVPETGLSMGGDYYTFYYGECYKHHSLDAGTFTTFYSTPTNPHVEFVFNESPMTIKNFNTLNYDGDPTWTCDEIITDMQKGTVNSFIAKENKWFSYINGDQDVSGSEGILNAIKDFNFQGIGTAKETIPNYVP